MDDDSGLDLRLVLALALASVAVGGGVDLAMDQPRDWLSFHVVFETTMVAGALLMVITLWLGWWRAQKSVGELTRRLEERRAERDAWKASARRALDGLGEAIDEQFRAWDLTPAEREVAMLLLKGYSHKRVAKVTGRSERTARQHAANAYHKAGLASRAELAGFFLEDLFLPDGTGGTAAEEATMGAAEG